MAIDSKKIAKNLFFVYGRIISITLIGLFSTRYALQALGQSNYGLFNVVGGIIAILAIVNTAMSTTTRRFINIENGKKDGDLNKIFNCCFITNFGLGLLLLLLAETLGMLYIYFLLNVPENQLSTAITIFNISTITSAISILFVPFLSLLESHENFGKIALVDIIITLIRLFLIISLLYYNGNRLILYTLFISFDIIVKGFIYIFYCKRYWPSIIKFKINKDWKLYKQVIIFNNYVSLGAATYVARNQGSNMLVNYFFGTIVNGAMSIAYALESYAIIIISNLTTAAAPQITKSYGAGETDDSILLASRINRISILFMSALVFIAYIELPTYLSIWLGEIPEGALILCQCTLISALVRSFSEGLSPLIQATGKIKWFQICGSISQAICLFIGWIFFKNGFPPQTIIICFIGTTLFNLGMTLTLSRIVLGTNDIIYFVKSSLKPNLFILLIYFVYYLCIKLCFYNINPIINILIGVVLSIFLIYNIGLTHLEKKRIKDIVISKF